MSGGGGIGKAIGQAAGVAVGGVAGPVGMWAGFEGGGQVGHAIGQGVSDLYGDLTGAGAADAAGNSAMATLAAARESRAAILKESARGEADIMRLAAASPDELRSYTQALASSEKQLASDENLLKAIDPAILEASNKLLAIVRGENNPVAPLEAQRTQQRAKLVDSLRQQYGPGAESSSIGLKALRDFDIQSSADLFGQGAAARSNEMQGLGNILNLYGGMRSGIDLQARGMNTFGLSSVFRNRELNARTGINQTNLAALAGADAPVIQNAGAPFVADQARAQGKQALLGGLLNAGVAGGLAAMGGGKKAV